MCIDIGYNTTHLLTFRINLRLEYTFLLVKLNLGVKNFFFLVLQKIFVLAARRHKIRGRKRQQVNFLIKGEIWASTFA